SGGRKRPQTGQKNSCELVCQHKCSEKAFLKSQTAGERETGKKPDQRTPICDKNIQDTSLGAEKKDLGDKVKENQPLPIQSQPGVCWPCPDGTFVKLILKAGTGLDKPKEGSFCQAKDSWEMSASEKWDLVLSNKERGSELYRAGAIAAAARRYARALRLLVVAPPPPDYDQIKAELHTNLAACQLRLHQPANAAQNCSKTLVLQPANPKALFRRGLAYDAMNDLEGAAQDLKGVLQVEPGNRAARRELDRVTERIRARDARLAQAMQKMFA
uniref:FKBP prolyl isomerase like n=1 Tax=Laticauda laticaudata TaxID=8630 RepID=A0A8C5RXN0_LATLA